MYIYYEIRTFDGLLKSPLWDALPPSGDIGEFRVINFGSTDRIHCDKNDAGLTMILIITDHPEHSFCMPEIGKMPVTRCYI